MDQSQTHWKEAALAWRRENSGRQSGHYRFDEVFGGGGSRNGKAHRRTSWHASGMEPFLEGHSQYVRGSVSHCFYVIENGACL